MTYRFIKNFLVEGKPTTLEINKLEYKLDELSPVLSQEALEYHYDNLAKTYAKRYNAGEGDLKFNEAGVFLHNTLFQQYRAPTGSNKPVGTVLEFIEDHYKDFDNFKETFAKEAMSIQGSGWVYLSTSGKIKTITNHEIKNDIVILIDWWEHAMYDYKWDKKSYLNNQWKIINWDVINSRF